MNRFEYVTPQTTQEAIKELVTGTAKAGGTDLVPLMKDRILAPKKIVSLLKLDLRNKTFDRLGIRIGALTTLAEVAADETLRSEYAAFAQAAEEAATPQIRNMATVGGNLVQRPRCWYFRSDQFDCRKKGGEGCPALEGDNRYHAIFENAKCAAVHPSNLAVALAAMEGHVDIVGPKGESSIAAASLFEVGDEVTREHTLGPQDIITQVRIPTGWKSVFLEVRERQSFDWPLVSVAAAKKGEKVNVVLGGVAPKPYRCPSADPDEILKAAKPLSHNAYKLKLVRTLVTRALEAIR